MNFDEWLSDFLRGKKEVPTLEKSSTASVHSVKRYTDSKGEFWEVAFTFTGRLVVRSGQIETNGKRVFWNAWETKHDVKLS